MIPESIQATSKNVAARASWWSHIWKHKTEYLLISPFFIIFGIFHGYPLLWSLWLSFHRWQGVGEARWFGFGNYERLLTNPRTWQALGNTCIFLLVLLPLIVALALVLATMLDSPMIKGRQLFRVMFFMPFITSIVIVAIIFQLLLNDNIGWINGILSALHLPRVPWLSETWPARLAIMAMVLWGVTGYNVLIMLGGLQSIPEVLYDAASIDGASTLQKFFNITIPLMQGVTLFVTMTSTIALLNLFTQPWLLFPSIQGRGPDGSTDTLNTIQYATAFTSSRFGEAAAMGFIIAIIVFAVALIQLRLGRARD